jgi:class 3 adenylate cyclase
VGLAQDDAALDALARRMRLGASPGAARALGEMNAEIDVRPVLPSVQVPTLVLYSPEREEPARYVADRMPNAELAESGPGEADDLQRLEVFLRRAASGHARRANEPERVLATVLFTDLVGSTSKAVELGPKWQDKLREHNQRIRRELARHSGREIDTAGDGFFASGFDGPARAIRCACAIRDSVSDLGLNVRIGVHTGECDVVDGKLSGLAVVIGARVAEQAETGEVLVSGTVRDLVAGSGIEFERRGVRDLKGIGPGCYTRSWRHDAPGKCSSVRSVSPGSCNRGSGRNPITGEASEVPGNGLATPGTRLKPAHAQSARRTPVDPCLTGRLQRASLAVA